MEDIEALIAYFSSVLEEGRDPTQVRLFRDATAVTVVLGSSLRDLALKPATSVSHRLSLPVAPPPLQDALWATLTEDTRRAMLATITGVDTAAAAESAPPPGATFTALSPAVPAPASELPAAGEVGEVGATDEAGDSGVPIGAGHGAREEAPVVGRKRRRAAGGGAGVTASPPSARDAAGGGSEGTDAEDCGDGVTAEQGEMGALMRQAQRKRVKMSRAVATARHAHVLSMMHGAGDVLLPHTEAAAEVEADAFVYAAAVVAGLRLALGRDAIRIRDLADMMPLAMHAYLQWKLMRGLATGPAAAPGDAGVDAAADIDGLGDVVGDDQGSGDSIAAVGLRPARATAKDVLADFDPYDEAYQSTAAVSTAAVTAGGVATVAEALEADMAAAADPAAPAKAALPPSQVTLSGGGDVEGEAEDEDDLASMLAAAADDFRDALWRRGAGEEGGGESTTSPPLASSSAKSRARGAASAKSSARAPRLLSDADIADSSVWTTFVARVNAAEARSASMTMQSYADYATARNVGFTVRSGPLYRRFLAALPHPPLSKVVAEAIGYLAYDRVCTVVEGAVKAATSGKAQWMDLAAPPVAVHHYRTAMQTAPRLPAELEVAIVAQQASSTATKRAATMRRAREAILAPPKPTSHRTARRPTSGDSALAAGDPAQDPTKPLRAATDAADVVTVPAATAAAPAPAIADDGDDGLDLSGLPGVGAGQAMRLSTLRAGGGGGGGGGKRKK